jgi:ArsR family transcriptional regulator
MKVLVEAGLLTREQRGRWAYYRLVAGAADDIAAALLRPLQRV